MFMDTNLEPIEESDLELDKKFGQAGGKFSPEEKKDDSEKPEAAFEENKKEAASEIISAEKDSAYNKILSKVKQPAKQAGSEDEVKSDAETASQKTDAESQVQHLIDLALNKGVVHAVKVAKHLEDNYALDMFHDKLLAEEFHKALKEKGIIKNS